MTEKDPITGLYPYQQEIIDFLEEQHGEIDTRKLMINPYSRGKSEIARIVAALDIPVISLADLGPMRRGTSPTIMIIDDPMDETQTPEQREAVWDWMVGRIDELNPNAKVLLDDIGTPVDELMRGPRVITFDPGQHRVAEAAAKAFMASAPEDKPRPHWQELNGGDKPWKRRKQRK